MAKKRLEAIAHSTNNWLAKAILSAAHHKAGGMGLLQPKRASNPAVTITASVPISMTAGAKNLSQFLVPCPTFDRSAKRSELRGINIQALSSWVNRFNPKNAQPPGQSSLPAERKRRMPAVTVANTSCAAHARTPLEFPASGLVFEILVS